MMNWFSKKESGGKITEIWIHPVKSLGGIQLQSCVLDEYGFKHDRQYMIAVPQTENVEEKQDKDGSDDSDISNSSDNGEKVPQYKFITQREHPNLTLVKVSIDHQSDKIILTYTPTGTTISLPLTPPSYRPELQVVAVEIWGEKPSAMDMRAILDRNEITEFFSRLEIKDPENATFVTPYRRRNVLRGAPPKGSLPRGTATSNFQDYFPGNIITKESMDDLADRIRLKAQAKGETEYVHICSRNFRPNIVVQGTKKAWDEDDWKRISVRSEIVGDKGTFYVACRNVRCQIPTINLTTGNFEPSHEPYKTMQSFRRIDQGAKYHPCFGMNLIHERPGFEVCVGDSVVVHERGDHFYQSIYG